MPAIDSSVLPADRLGLRGNAPQVSNDGIRIEHSRGSGLAPNGVWLWSSYKGEVQDLVAISEPRSRGLLGGVQRKSLPTTTAAIDTTIAPAAINPQLTRHLSAGLHNLIVDLMGSSVLNRRLTNVGGGIWMANYALTGTSGPIGLSLRVDTRQNSADVTALGISWPSGQQVGAPIPIPAVQLGGLTVTAPLEVLERHPWLESVLSQAVLFGVSLQPQDPLEPTLRTAHFKQGESPTVKVKLRQTPDGTYQVIDAEERFPRLTQPQNGFSYSRGAILYKVRGNPGRRMQFSNIQASNPGVKVEMLENILEAARQATAWTPGGLNSKQWFTSVHANGATHTLCIDFDDDTLDHAVDIQEYVPGRVISEVQSEHRLFDTWAPKPQIPGRCQRIVQTWFKDTEAHKKWSEANPFGNAAGFINEALQACAAFEARYSGQVGVPQRSDGTLATCTPWGGDTARHIYRYDTVVSGQDVSLLVEFSHPNRRVWMSMAMLPPGEQPDVAKIKGILLYSR